MVIYEQENDLTWFPLPDKGIELALLAHADPGQLHGECLGLSQVFSLASTFGATPISHTLSNELMVQYPEQLELLLRCAGSNHSWLTSTLCIYTGEGKKKLRPKKERWEDLPAFGFVEKKSMTEIVTPTDNENIYRVYNQDTKAYKESNVAHISSFLYVDVPEEQHNKCLLVMHPHYALLKNQGKVHIEINWENVQEVPLYKRPNTSGTRITTNAILPMQTQQGLPETDIFLNNPTLGFIAPAESYACSTRGAKNNNFWIISTHAEGAIIQRSLR